MCVINSAEESLGDAMAAKVIQNHMAKFVREVMTTIGVMMGQVGFL
jgi:hypothetical protein